MTQRRTQVQLQRKPRPTRSTTTRNRDRDQTTDRHEIRQDVRRVWFPED